MIAMAKPKKNAIESMFSVGFRTDVGLVRTHNEDSMLVELPLLVVADGVGGREAGEVASGIATQKMLELAPRVPDAEALGEAVEAANHAIISAAVSGEGKPGMGTTLTAAVTDGKHIAIAQVGDSRAYLMRAGQLEQLTHDHSLVAAMVESGQLTESEALIHPSRSIITRALGSDPEMFADLYEFDLETNDRIVLCTDGLCGALFEEDIKEILLDSPDPQQAANRLVYAANQAGGHDNVTVIVADLTSTASTNKTTTKTLSASQIDKRHKRRRRIGIAAFIVVAFLLVAGAVFGFCFYVRNSAYLILEDGEIAVYSGRMEDFMGMNYSEFQYSSDIEVEYLPAYLQQSLEEGVQFDSFEDAQAALNSYAQQIANSQGTTSASEDSSQDSTASESSGD